MKKKSFIRHSSCFTGCDGFGTTKLAQETKGQLIRSTDTLKTEISLFLKGASWREKHNIVFIGKIHPFYYTVYTYRRTFL